MLALLRKRKGLLVDPFPIPKIQPHPTPFQFDSYRLKTRTNSSYPPTIGIYLPHTKKNNSKAGINWYYSLKEDPIPEPLVS